MIRVYYPPAQDKLLCTWFDRLTLYQDPAYAREKFVLVQSISIDSKRHKGGLFPLPAKDTAECSAAVIHDEAIPSAVSKQIESSWHNLVYLQPLACGNW